MQPNELCNATVHFTDEVNQKESYQTFPLHLSEETLDWYVLECNAVWCPLCAPMYTMNIYHRILVLHEMQVFLSMDWAETLAVHLQACLCTPR